MTTLPDLEPAALDLWYAATNSVCQTMQERGMCKCPDGDCLAAKIDPDPADIAHYLAARPTAQEAGKAVDVTRIDILREWFGGERYARDYEYLDASFGEQADRVVAYLSTLASVPAPSGAEPVDGPEEIEIDRLRLAAFRTNSNEDKAAYYLAVSKWFQDRHYRRLASEAEATSLRRRLGELLAVIHRDGGHYQDFAGTEQSVADAQSAVVLLFQAQDERNDLRRKLEEHRKALEPFADVADMLSGPSSKWQDHETHWPLKITDAISVGDLRRARALSEREGQE